MPPPKEQKKKKEGPKVIVGPPQPELIDEHTKEFYLIQIRDLEERVDKYQKRCDELEIKNGEFQSKFDKMSDDKKDIVLFIKKKLDEKIDEIAEVSDHLVGLQQAKDAEKEMFEQQIQQLRTEYQETKDQLTSENMMLAGKLASLEEFKIQREEFFEKIKDLENDLFIQEGEHRDAKYTLEKKHVMDKDRLKKEMITKVSQVASEFRKVSNRQMSETTKRTIRENVSINSQLTKMSDKTIELIKENDDLRARELKQRHQIEILEANEKELARRNVSNQKVIHLLNEKCKKHGDATASSLEGSLVKYLSLQEERNMLREKLDSTREELHDIMEHNDILGKQRHENKELLEEKILLRSKLEQLIIDSAAAVEGVIKPSVSEDCVDTSADISAKRDQLMESFLLLLNSAKEIKTNKPGTSEHIEETNKPLSTDILLPRYQPGNLGFVPGVDQQLPNKMDSFKLREDNNFPKRKGKTVSTQTASSTKALFLADQLVSKMPIKGMKLHPSLPTNEKSLPPLSKSQSSVSFFPTGLVH